MINLPQPNQMKQNHKLTVIYYAVLRDQRGLDSETIETEVETPLALFSQLKEEHGFSLEPEQMRVAVNDEIADWQVKLADNDVIVFLPPVAGG